MFFNNPLRKIKNLYPSTVPLKPIIPSQPSWLMDATKLILKVWGDKTFHPGNPLLVHPYMSVVFLVMLNSSTYTILWKLLWNQSIILLQLLISSGVLSVTCFGIKSPNFLYDIPTFFLRVMLRVDKATVPRSVNFDRRASRSWGSVNCFSPLLFTQATIHSKCWCLIFLPGLISALQSLSSRLFLHLNCLIIDRILAFDRPTFSSTSRICNFWTRDQYIASFCASVNSGGLSSSSSHIGESADLGMCIFSLMNFCDNSIVQAIFLAAINYPNHRLLCIQVFSFLWLSDSYLLF